jgi:cysteine desulfurase
VTDRHYLDHASTSPPRPGVADAMLRWLSLAADPGRVHTEGRMARAAVEEARESVAALLGVRPRSVIFTSGATEAANAAVWGAGTGTVVCAAVEHSCVRDASARAGPVVIAPVDRSGRVDAAFVAAALRDQPALVHCQWANHEVGTLQPVAEVVGLCRSAGVLVHVDAAQAVGHVPVDLDALGADLVSVSGHKFGGPPGTGALIVRRGLRVRPFIVGGEQERARRGGMENVAAVAGLGAAAEAVAASLADEGASARRQTAALLEAALAVPGVTGYGDPVERVPHIVCVGVEGVEAEAVLLGLDQAGIAAHSGSACSSESLEPSPVLAAMGVDAERSLRLSVGWSTTAADVDAFATAFGGVVARLRALR